MFTFNAMGSMVTVSLIRGTLSEIVKRHRMMPAKCVLHPAQLISWEYAAMTSLREPDPTIPINQDIREPKDRIQFKDADDNVLAEIVTLGLPMGFDWPAVETHAR